MSTEKPKGNNPVHEVLSIDGLIKVSIWKNDGKYGTDYDVTCRRRYKAGEEWKDSYSYRGDDALSLSKLLDLAHTWMLNQRQQQRSQKAAA